MNIRLIMYISSIHLTPNLINMILRYFVMRIFQRLQQLIILLTILINQLVKIRSYVNILILNTMLQ